MATNKRTSWECKKCNVRWPSDLVFCGYCGAAGPAEMTEDERIALGSSQQYERDEMIGCSILGNLPTQALRTGFAKEDAISAARTARELLGVDSMWSANESLRKKLDDTREDLASERRHRAAERDARLALSRDLDRLRDEANEERATAQLWQGEATEAKEELATAKAKLALVEVSDAEGVWYWQGDGGDRLDSLVCPVVMSADRLREISAELGNPLSDHELRVFCLDYFATPNLRGEPFEEQFVSMLRGRFAGRAIGGKAKNSENTVGCEDGRGTSQYPEKTSPSNRGTAAPVSQQSAAAQGYESGLVCGHAYPDGSHCARPKVTCQEHGEPARYPTPALNAVPRFSPHTGLRERGMHEDNDGKWLPLSRMYFAVQSDILAAVDDALRAIGVNEDSTPRLNDVVFSFMNPSLRTDQIRGAARQDIGAAVKPLRERIAELEAAAKPMRKRLDEFELAAGEAQGIDEENHHLRLRVADQAKRIAELELQVAEFGDLPTRKDYEETIERLNAKIRDQKDEIVGLHETRRDLTEEADRLRKLAEGTKTPPTPTFVPSAETRRLLAALDADLAGMSNHDVLGNEDWADEVEKAIRHIRDLLAAQAAGKAGK